jgi:hypothetical protein
MAAQAPTYRASPETAAGSPNRVPAATEQAVPTGGIAESSSVALRPRGVLETFDLSLRFILEHWRMYAAVAAIVLLPTWILHAIVAEKLGMATLLIIWLPSAVAVRAIFTLLAAVLVFERNLTLRSFRGRLRAAFGGILRFAFVACLLGAICAALTDVEDSGTLGGLLATGFIPIFLLAAVQYFTLEATVLERATYFQSWKRSRVLVSGGAGDTAGGLFLLTILHALAYLLGDVGGRSIITDLLMSSAPTSIMSEGVTTLALLGFWLAVPFIATARFLLYVNVRTVMEGWDIQTQFVRIALQWREDAS